MGDTGTEQPVKKPQNAIISTSRGTESGTIRPELPADLVELAKSWHNLPAGMRDGILAMVRASGESR